MEKYGFFIISSYGVTFITLTALCLAIYWDSRRQQKQLKQLEDLGIKRRSDSE